MKLKKFTDNLMQALALHVPPRHLDEAEEITRVSDTELLVRVKGGDTFRLRIERDSGDA